MTTTIIITFCVLLLLAYIFDISAPKTKIPSVILLLFLGWSVNKLSYLIEFSIPDLTPLLPILGTIGLILIVLEGALELELNKSKIPIIRKSALMALLPMLLLSFLLAYSFSELYHLPLKLCLINLIPLCVISSAIAISTVKSLSGQNREFVIYESSLSDIFGVLLFNFVKFNEALNMNAIGGFSLQLLIIILISFAGSMLLAFLLNKIEHHVKFAPIIILVILIYEISKVYHLPSLLFILLFGLFIGNLDEFKNIKWISRMHPEKLNAEVKKFKEIVAESTFLVRTVFFLLFGYLLESSDVLDPNTLPWAFLIVAAIFSIRVLGLKLAGLPLKPLLFIAPRGLITILLFLSIKPEQGIFIVNRSLVIQVVILTALIMMTGMILGKDKRRVAEPSSPD
jgi:hypothetical protein